MDPRPARRSFKALLRITSPVVHSWSFGAGFAIARSIVVKRVPRGARVRVRCSGRGCPFARMAVKPDRRRRADAARRLRGRTLRTGTVVDIRITARNAIGLIARFRVLDNKLPRKTTLCLRSGAKKPRRC